MARSEIDDIFAAKKSAAAARPVASTSTPTDATSSKKKKRDKKRKGDALDPCGNEEKPRKKRVVETVHDTSITIPSVSSSKKGKSTSTRLPKAAKKEKEDLDRFKDSRGTGPREWCLSVDDIRLWSYGTIGRKTEEGFTIFKEAELGINPEAGGTWSLTFSSAQN